MTKNSDDIADTPAQITNLYEEVRTELCYRWKLLARVGYFEGTAPLLLSTLAAEGVETLPVANMWDHHGKYVSHLSKGEVNVVVGYLHKILPAEEVRTALLSIMVDDMLSACKIHDIPVLLIVPATLHEKAKKILGDTKVNIRLVAPEELEAQIRKHL